MAIGKVNLLVPVYTICFIIAVLFLNTTSPNILQNKTSLTNKLLAVVIEFD